MQGKPLDGLTVIDLTQIYNGPYAAFLMAQGGADVLKVEPVGGERMRGAGGEQTPMAFAMLNSNKKSLTLNLKDERGKGMLCDLVRQADVLLENYAPGVMDRLGVGWEVLRNINPRLIYGTSTGYGLSGPDSDLLAMDHTIQAAAGIMSVTGDADRPPGRAGGAPCDIMGGIHLYSGVMTALVGRGIKGHGTRVEVSMLESMYFTLCSELTAYHASGELPTRNSARSPAGACPYSRYECSDGGYIAMICVAPAHWDKILQVIGRADLIGHENFRSAPRRKAREDEVNQMIGDWTMQHTRDVAYQAFREARVPVAPVRNIEEVRTDAHLHERGMLRWMNHPDMGDIVLPRSPIRFSDFDNTEVTLFPEPGAHNAQVYGDMLGVDEQNLQALADAGVI